MRGDIGRAGFCGTCGSHLHAEQTDGAYANVRLGILDDEPTARPALDVRCGSRARWREIADGLPRFERIPGEM